MKSKLYQTVVALALALLVVPGSACGADVAKKIVLIAGVKSHGPEGNRIHDYGWSVKLLKTMLENSDIAKGVQVETHFNGWPTNSSAFDDAATIVIISDGRDGDKYSEAPHLESPARVKFVDQLMKRGCGIITFHFSTFAPDVYADSVLDWYGGYFDWETDGKREWYSAITTMETEIHPATPGHPVLNGVKPFRMNEEFYYDIRFRVDKSQWSPLLKVDALPAKKPNGNVVGWAVQRPDGGRGFATTCGHFYDNWEHEGFRKTMLNAIAWTAKLEVPTDGVSSKMPNRAAINLHLNDGQN